ncbi:MAG TPA: AAA family ATPase, partial [Planctomycetaceae bacterium]|nr:AAA family ATPase [Planctomycetaceae bacterium]
MKADHMYQAHFRLEKRPFSATPDPACFFVTEPIQEAFDELVLRAESGQGIGVLTGPAGTGKTLVCRRIAVEVSKHFTPIFLANASFPTRRALLQSILFELGRRYTRMEEQELRLAVFTSLKDLALAGRGAVLIVDEAHLMNERLLEELRMLASLSDREEPLARVILSAQLSLEERLVHPGLEALNQRVVCHRYIEPLTREESIAYVKFRIEWAGGEWAQVFSPQALARIAEAAGGLPRCLNQLCDHVLLLTYAQNQRCVTPEAVDEALLDLKQLPQHWHTSLTAQEPFESADSPQSSHASDENRLDDAIEWSPLPADVAAPPSDRSETVCIEIGGAEDGSEPAVADSQGANPGYTEEIVDDRYAMLDVRSPRILRTFDDLAVPEMWLPSRNATVPLAPQPAPIADWPSSNEMPHPVIIDGPDPDPDRTIDEMPLMVEDRLETSILDACLEAQATIGRWNEAPHADVSIIEPRHNPAADEPAASPSTADYDVVEPDGAPEAQADARAASEGRESPPQTFG